MYLLEREESAAHRRSGSRSGLLRRGLRRDEGRKEEYGQSCANN
jgi:hypothetical protein